MNCATTNAFFANDRRSFRNGITNTKRYPQAQHKNTATPIPFFLLSSVYPEDAHKKKQADTHKDTCLSIAKTVSF